MINFLYKGVSILDYITSLVENIGIIKDILWIIFTLIATIVAVLTYKRARLTFLQPLRSEVVKRQIDEMIELLNFLNTDNLDEKIDYYNILLGNFEIKMDEIGFSDETVKKRVKYYEDMFVGTYITKDTFDENRYYPITPFFNPNKIKDKKTKTDFELLQEGIVKLHGIKITKQHSNYMNEFEKYLESPIIPTKIKEKLELIMKDINENITIKIPMIIKTVVLSVYEKQINNVSAIGIINLFSEIKKKHDEQIKDLRKEIRDYLKIDLEW